MIVICSPTVFPQTSKAIRYTGEPENCDEIRELTKRNIITKRVFQNVETSLSENLDFNSVFKFHIGDWIIVDAEKHIKIMDDINFNKAYDVVGKYQTTEPKHKFKLINPKTIDAWQFDGTLGSIIDATERTNMNFVSETWCGKREVGLSHGDSFDPQYRLEVGDWVILTEDRSIKIMSDMDFKHTYTSAE